jgi:hypothetical protein
MANELFDHTTIREIIASFSHAVEEKTGRPFRDFRWPNKLIYFHLINVRADIVYQTRKQNQLEDNYEDYNELIPCIEMHEVDMTAECPCAPASNCKWMKSVLPLPTYVGSAPTAVTTVDGLNKYDFVEWTMFKHMINNRIQAANDELRYTHRVVKNERWLYTYILKEKNIVPTKAKAVSVWGVPVDPMEIALYPICGEKPKQNCDILDLKFIIEKRLINLLFDTTYKKLISINNATRMGDTKNDDRNAETATDPRL